MTASPTSEQVMPPLPNFGNIHSWVFGAGGAVIGLVSGVVTVVGFWLYWADVPNREVLGEVRQTHREIIQTKSEILDRLPSARQSHPDIGVSVPSTVHGGKLGTANPDAIPAKPNLEVPPARQAIAPKIASTEISGEPRDPLLAPRYGTISTVPVVEETDADRHAAEFQRLAEAKTAADEEERFNKERKRTEDIREGYQELDRAAAASRDLQWNKQQLSNLGFRIEERTAFAGGTLINTIKVTKITDCALSCIRVSCINFTFYENFESDRLHYCGLHDADARPYTNGGYIGGIRK